MQAEHLGFGDQSKNERIISTFLIAFSPCEQQAQTQSARVTHTHLALDTGNGSKQSTQTCVSQVEENWKELGPNPAHLTFPGMSLSVVIVLSKIYICLISISKSLVSCET